MNIFYLHPDPVTCAQMHCDKHASKMCVEYAQMLSTAHRVVDGSFWYGRTTNGRRVARYLHPDTDMQHNLYKAVHINHPSTQWVRACGENYSWMYDTWTALCAEYQHRYGRTHESFAKLEYFLMLPPANIKDHKFFQPTPAMKEFPQCIVEGDSLQSYRNYYWEAKRSFAKWSRRDVPSWWQELLEEENGGQGRQATTNESGS